MRDCNKTLIKKLESMPFGNPIPLTDAVKFFYHDDEEDVWRINVPIDARVE